MNTPKEINQMTDLEVLLKNHESTKKLLDGKCNFFDTYGSEIVDLTWNFLKSRNWVGYQAMKSPSEIINVKNDTKPAIAMNAKSRKTKLSLDLTNPPSEELIRKTSWDLAWEIDEEVLKNIIDNASMQVTCNSSDRKTVFKEVKQAICQKICDFYGEKESKSRLPNWMATPSHILPKNYELKNIRHFHHDINYRNKNYTNKIVFGYKGSSEMETGYLMAPHSLLLPVQRSENTYGSVFRAGKKLVNPDFYAVVTIE